MKGFVGKFVLMAALVAASQILLANVLESRLHPMRDLADAQTKGPTDLLFFADSVFGYTYRNDADPRPLADMLRAELPDRHLAIVQGRGYAAEVYLDILNYLFHRGVKPRAVIVTVNLRAFSPNWDQRPDFQFSSDLLRLRWGDTLGLAADRPMAAYQGYSRLEGYPSTLRDYENLPFRRGERPMGTIRDLMDGRGVWAGASMPERLFSLTYLSPLDSGHRKIRSLQRLLHACRAAGVPVLAYVTPIDVESGDRAVGPEFRPLVNRNIAVLRAAFSDGGTPLIDLSYALDSRHFDWNKFPNEHLRESGRRWLARELASRVRQAGF